MSALLAGMVLVFALGGTAPVAEEPRIVEAYPNPAAQGDDGEFVTLHVPPGTDLSAYTLADDHGRVSLATINATVEDGRRLTLSTNATLTARLTEGPAVEIDGGIRLANRGDRLRLLRNGTVVDTLRYDRAPEAEVLNATDGTWTPLGATDRPVVTARHGTAEAFVLPDEPDRVVELLKGAEERILLAGYTFSSERVVEALIAADREGLTVRVLVEGSPVGGLTGRSAASLDRLDRAGVSVSVVAGKRERYNWHHAKYAVVDDRALVTTENWKPSGTGGHGSRGWAVITHEESIVRGLADTFRADTGWHDTVAWDEFERAALVEADPASGRYETAFEAKRVRVDRTRLLVAPDNAEAQLRELLAGADRTVDIKQVRIGDRNFPLLQAAISAAERGVRVRILLSGAWYTAEENRQLVAWLNDRAAAEGLPLEARVDDPDGAYRRIHAKGIVVDGDTVVVGSLNWNNNSFRENREVALLLEGEAVAGYYGAVFESDWTDDGSRLPAGVLGAVLIGALAALVVATRVRFDG